MWRQSFRAAIFLFELCVCVCVCVCFVHWYTESLEECQISIIPQLTFAEGVRYFWCWIKLHFHCYRCFLIMVYLWQHIREDDHHIWHLFLRGYVLFCSKASGMVQDWVLDLSVPYKVSRGLLCPDFSLCYDKVKKFMSCSLNHKECLLIG